MVLDYCPGGDLSKLIREMEVLTFEEARFYLAEIVLGLETLHEAGILYRDFKPENILLDSQGHIKLADFGLSKEGIGSDDLTNTFCGSPIYVPPELAS